MTETARQSDYVLPATTQYEKFEATFFNFEFPQNVFHLRRPVLDPPDGSAARAGDPRPTRRGASGFLDGDTIEQLRAAATRDRDEFAAAFAQAIDERPEARPRSRRWCCTARSARRSRTARRRRPRCGRWRSAARR